MITFTYTDTRDTSLTTALLRLWEESVRASHHFLSPGDIEALKPFVVEGIKQIPVLCVARDGDAPVAFMGVEDGKIEMLFVSPACFGRGIGRRMVELAVREHHATLVDANEQNPQAVGFYRHMGFEVYGRTETDGQGNPFPILRMRLEQKEEMNVIETERLTLRPWTANDAEALYKYASDSRVSELALWPRHESVEMSRMVIEKYFIPYPPTLAVVLKATGEPVGCIGLVPEGLEHYVTEPGEREVGYWIGRPYWGQGLTPEALEALIRHLSTTTDIPSLLLTTDLRNTASQRVAEKCGFRFVGEYTHEGTEGKAYRLPLRENGFGLLCDYFSGMERQGPGSDGTTQEALDIILRLARKQLTDIADLGCGTGASTIQFLHYTTAHVTALDLFPTFVSKLRQRVAAEELDKRLTAMTGDMSALPFEEEEFDLIWSEGAIYNIGFEQGLKAWHRHIRKGGFVAVTEISWLTDSRPEEIERF